MNTDIDFDELSDALQRIGCLQGASEVHGGVCGALCVTDPEQVDLRRILDPAEDQEFQAHAIAEATLARLCEACARSLEDRGLGFTPTLPDDDQPLAERVAALSSWCEGFLFGLACHRELDLDQCSESLQEIVGDITEFTRAAVTLDEQSPGESDERAYTELVEYIRVGVQIVYIELRGGAPEANDAATDTPTLH